MTLGISLEDLLSHYKEDRDSQGLRRSYLEGVARRMDGAKRWGYYIDIMALIMFGIVLLPNVRDFMDDDAISIFWNVKNLEMDPVPSLLVDIYYTMSIFHGMEKGSLRCCIPLLYQWLEQDKESLEHSLYNVTYEKNQIIFDLEQKDKQLLENMEELWTERSKRQKTLGGLVSARVNFENLNGKLKEAQAEGHKWKRAWEQQESKSVVMTQIHGFEEALAKSQAIAARQ
ncbi:hypothetical protein KIW84_043715 [Lathyrus oleraceus]|uniref:DUF7745 domain-containing protein n=1 Tax=Pisum sativum TaxID=3888 RepID=A0A9D4XGB3_PEA|nr:hypothetical protein KIW84_043715 [Pisum sativum]